jgi:hypothetical protein
MSSITILRLTKNTAKLYNSKLIHNANCAIYGSDCNFKGKFTNISNMYFMNYSDEFIKKNLKKFNSPNMYFTKLFFNYDSYYELQKILNQNSHTKIFVNENYYDKFISNLENSTKYIMGETFDNSNQIFKFDYDTFNKQKFTVEEVFMSEINFKKIINSSLQ